MNAYNEIHNFLVHRANHAEFREDFWGFVEDATHRFKLLVVTDPYSMRREYQYHYPVKTFFGFREKEEVVVIDRNDVSPVEWYSLEDALYYACERAKEI